MAPVVLRAQLPPHGNHPPPLASIDLLEQPELLEDQRVGLDGGQVLLQEGAHVGVDRTAVEGRCSLQETQLRRGNPDQQLVVLRVVGSGSSQGIPTSKVPLV